MKIRKGDVVICAYLGGQQATRIALTDSIEMDGNTHFIACHADELAAEVLTCVVLVCPLRIIDNIGDDQW